MSTISATFSALLLVILMTSAHASPAQTIYDTRAGKTVTQAAMLDQLARADVVFVGEQHDDEATHALELQILDGLRRRAGARLTLSLEMFERDTQPSLDDYLGGRIGEAAFLKAARPWANYRTDYRPLVEYAKANHVPVVAANAPQAWVTKARRGGLTALADAPPGLVASPEFVPHDAYWMRFHGLMAAMGGDHGGGPTMSEADVARLFEAQSVWDATMADSVVRRLNAHPAALVLHVNGQFHSDYGGGVPRRVLWARPLTRAVLVSVVPVPTLPASLSVGDRARGDFVVYVRVQ